jgi:hypothetical protein
MAIALSYRHGNRFHESEHRQVTNQLRIRIRILHLTYPRAISSRTTALAPCSPYELCYQYSIAMFMATARTKNREVTTDI